MYKIRTLLFFSICVTFNAILLAKSESTQPKFVTDLATKLFSDAEFDNFSISPKGEYLALSLIKDDHRRISVMDLKSKKTSHTELNNNDFLLYLHWIDKDSLVFATGVMHVYFGSLYVIHSDKKKFSELVNNRYVRLLDPLPDISDIALVTSPNQHGRFSDVFRLNTKNEVNTNLTQVVNNPGNIRGWLTDKNGVVRVGIYDTDIHSNEKIRYREDADSKWIDIELPVATFPMDLMGDGSSMIVSSAQGKKTFGMYLFDLNTSKISRQIVHLNDYSLENETVSLLRDITTYDIVGLKVDRQKPLYLYFSETYQTLQKNINQALPNRNIHILGYNAELREVYFYAESDTTPGALYLFDLEKVHISKIIDRYPSLHDFSFCQTEPIVFSARDGVSIHGYLTMPTASSDRLPPLITIVHGGPWVRDTWGYNPEVQFFASMGYAVLQINYRGSSGYSLDYSDIPLEAIMNYSITDVADGCKWLIKEGRVDKERIAIYGGSFGGYAALAGAAFEPDLYKCTVGFAGVYDWPAHKKSDSRRKNLPRWLTDAYTLADEALLKFSPSMYANNIKTPVLLIHGKDDTRVDVTQSRIMRNALNDAGVHCELESYSWVGHGFSNEDARIKFYERIANFINRYLQP